jgi:hypothetical protein
MVIQRSAVSSQLDCPSMKRTQSTLAHDLDARAAATLEEARAMPPGDERTEAMHKATTLRNAAEMHEVLCGKPDAPAE